MTRVKMRVNPNLDMDWKCERGRRPDRRMVQAKGQIVVLEPEKHGFDYVSWASDNQELLGESFGWDKSWLVPVNDLGEAVEL